MNRDNAIIVANIVDRITKLEKSIFDVQGLMNKNRFTIIGSDGTSGGSITVELKADEIATVVFTQDILEMYINTLNLELNELVKSLDDI